MIALACVETESGSLKVVLTGYTTEFELIVYVPNKLLSVVPL
jgi:hypothetical protein